MSIIKEMIDDYHQEKIDRKIAKELGLSYSDFLCLIPYNLNYNENETECNIEFCEDSPAEILSKISNLGDNNYVYLDVSKITIRNLYEADYVELIENNKMPQIIFEESLYNFERLIEIDLNDITLNVILKNQIFIGIISRLETFLADTYYNLVFNNEQYLENYKNLFSKYKTNKIELLKKEILNTNFQNINNVIVMYRKTFNIKLSTNNPRLKEFMKARHILVHKNGSMNKERPVVDNLVLNDLIFCVNNFVSETIIELEK